MRTSFLPLLFAHLLTGILLMASTPEVEARMPSPEAYLESALANDWLHTTSGEHFAWHARGAANDLIHGYEAYRDPAWLEAAETYFAFLIDRLQVDPDGFEGWIGRTIWDETGRAPGDADYRADSLVGDALLLAPMVRFAELVLKDPELEAFLGSTARRYVHLAERIGWEKWNRRGTYYRCTAGYGSYKMHDYLIDAETWEWTPQGDGDRRRSDNLNKHHAMGTVFLRLYRISGREEYRERVIEIYGRMKNLFRLLPGERVTWNFWMPHGPHDLRDDGSLRSWVAVHPNRSGYQAGEVGRMVEVYDSGLVFTRDDLQRMINTNHWMELPDGTWRSSDGSTDAGQLWTALARFDERIYQRAAAALENPTSDRGLMRLAHFEADVAPHRGWNRRNVRARDHAHEYALDPRPGEHLSMTMVVPNRFAAAGGETARLVTRVRGEGELRIELLDASGSRVLGALAVVQVDDAPTYLAPVWDGTNPETGRQQPGSFQLRWSISGESRTEPVWVE